MERNDHDLLTETHTIVKRIELAIADIPAKCAGHAERLKAIESRVSAHDAEIESLWGRWWWAVGLAITTLLTVVVGHFLR